jgi:PAS domain S-box-containing protein
MPGGVVHVGADGRVLHANPAACELLGLGFDELSQRYTHDFAPETLREDGSPCPVEEYPVSLALATGEPQPPTTIGVRKPNGEITWAVFRAIPVTEPASGEVVEAVVTFYDITARVRAEQEREESAAKLRAILDSSSSIIVLADLDGRIQYMNQSGITGRSPEEVTGTSLFDYVDDDQAAMIRGYIDQAVDTRKPVGYELSVAAPSGDNRVVAVSLAPVIHSDEVTALSLTMTDVTELRELQTRVVISDRMASVGILAAGVAHEINNPLTYLMLNLHRMRSIMAPTTEAVERMGKKLSSAIEGAERIRKIVAGLGAYSRDEDKEDELIDVGAVLTSCVEMAGNELRFRARVRRELGEVPVVSGSSSRLHQAFLNIVVNAAQAIPVGDVDGNEIILATRTRGDGHAEVEISDTGSGIPPDVRARIFDPFVTTKPIGEGTGLGLHICHSIITSMGGEISVRDGNPRGTTFTVALPPAPTRSTRPRQAVAPEPSPGAGPPMRLLIIDDEPAVLEALELALDDFDVVVASDGSGALQAITSEQFDVVLCDLMMPDVSGMDVYEGACAHDPSYEPRFVFMSGGPFTARASQFVARFPDRLIRKPCDIDSVRRFLRARAGQARQAPPNDG